MVVKRGPVPVSLGGRSFVSKAAAKRAVRRVLAEARVEEPLTNEDDRELAKGCALISDEAATLAEGWDRKVIIVRPDPHSGDLNLVFSKRTRTEVAPDRCNACDR